MLITESEEDQNKYKGRQDKHSRAESDDSESGTEIKKVRKKKKVVKVLIPLLSTYSPSRVKSISV